jgi:protein-L-isoaspartate(D-aspartate) O-methyltransferase
VTLDEDAAPYRQRLVEDLSANGHLVDPRWRDAFGAVPRHVFVPGFFDLTSDGLWRPVRASSTPQQLLEQVYRDRTCVTQLDGSTTAEGANSTMDGEPTSSSTEPGLMADMLAALEVHDGDSVIEIGTGTGYNSALLCHRLGSERVRSVEVDPAVAADAAGRLHQLGYEPTLLVGDGGTAGGPPVDRLIATCSFPAIPVHWLDLVKPGGIIVTIVYTRPFGMAIVRLTVGAGEASGEFILPGASFMEARTPPRGPVRVPHPDDLPAAVPRATRCELADLDRFPVNFLAGWVLGDATRFLRDDETPAMIVDQASQSWVAFDGDRVCEGGPRRIWQAVEQIVAAWQDTGRDALDGFRYEVGTGPGGLDMLVSRSTGATWPRMSGRPTRHR